MANTDGKDQKVGVTTEPADSGGRPRGNTKVNTDFEFVGEYLWLDFVNTGLVERERVVDLLGDVTDLFRWLRESGILGPSEAEVTLDRWRGTEEGERLLERAKEFRQTLREASEHFDENGSVAPSLVEEVNGLLSQGLGHYMLEPTVEGFEMRFHALPDGPETLLAPVAESVARFLADADPSLVKGCENPGCILYFYDTSKNHTRRWCSMSTCGNRMKARAHYERVQGRKDV